MNGAAGDPDRAYSCCMPRTLRLLLGVIGLLASPVLFIVLQPAPSHEAHGCMDGLAFGAPGSFDITHVLVAGFVGLISLGLLISSLDRGHAAAVDTDTI